MRTFAFESTADATDKRMEFGKLSAVAIKATPTLNDAEVPEFRNDQTIWNIVA